MKILRWTIVIVMILGVAGYLVYFYYVPDMVAKAIVSESEPAYVPKYVKLNLARYKKPINKSAEDVIAQMHATDVPISELIKAIDNVEEDDIRSMLAELNSKEIANPDQAFDIVKRFVHADFDLEVFRKPFKENVDPKMIQKGLHYTRSSTNQLLVDPDVAKAIIKNVLIQKEEEYIQKQHK